MTTHKETKQAVDKSMVFSRFMYGAFVVLSLYHLFIRHDLADGMSNMGIALIFDPFDQRVTWSYRPLFQRAWLIVHASIVLVLLGYLLVQALS
jgi:hypothetical protein